jgi:hypothetical protein
VAVDPRIIESLQASAEDAGSWEDVRQHLRTIDPEGEDKGLRPFHLAFAYSLLERTSKRRDRVGGPFGSMVAGEGWRYPPALSEIEEGDVEAWVEAFEALEVPILRARLGDLLWERRVQPRPDLRARAACDALLALAERDNWREIERARLLSRALELARAVGDEQRARSTMEAAIAFVEGDIASDQGGPGVSLVPLRSLVDLRPEDRPDALNDLLIRVGERYGADPYIMDAVAELRARLLDDDARQELRRGQVARWREESTKGDTMMRVFRLEQALELARTFDLQEEAEELRRELGDIRPEQLDLKEISAEVEISREEVDRFLSLFRDAPSWQAALNLLAAQPPPGGSPADLEAQVEQIMADSPIQFLFSKAIVGPESAGAIFRATDAASHRRVALAEERARAAGFWGLFAVDALDAVAETFERPTRAALTEFFTGELIDAEVAERIARALELYWDEQPDESAHLLVPRLERVIRGMARRVGVPVFREPQGDKPGGVEGLGSLLQDISGAFADPGWHAYLVVLLSDPLGLNLRNVISHGLAPQVGRPAAALLLQAACLLKSFDLTKPEQAPTPPIGAAQAPSPDDQVPDEPASASH